MFNLNYKRKIVLVVVVTYYLINLKWLTNGVSIVPPFLVLNEPVALPGFVPLYNLAKLFTNLDLKGRSHWLKNNNNNNDNNNNNTVIIQ